MLSKSSKTPSLQLAPLDPRRAPTHQSCATINSKHRDPRTPQLFFTPHHVHLMQPASREQNRPIMTIRISSKDWGDKKRGRYPVVDKAERTYRGVVFGSQTEMKRGAELM